MSTSAKPARISAPYRDLSPPVFQPFPYDAISPGSNQAAANADEQSDAHKEAAAQAAREAQAGLEGRQRGEAEARKQFEQKLVEERASLAATLAGFTRDRSAYFEKIEAQLVELALSIARRIMHREAQIDPLLLAGIVRVALEKIDGATVVVLRLNPQNVAEWRRYLSTHLDPGDMPEIVEDIAQPLDRCALETSMGTAVLGVEVQLKEIERGLMDLIAARPELSPSRPQVRNVGDTRGSSVGAGV